MNKLEKHIHTYMIHYTEFMAMDYTSVANLFDVNELYSFDTESSHKVEDGEPVARVYAWSIGNTGNDYQIYGEDINDIYIVFDKIARANNMEYNDCNGGKFKVFIHNLTWDFQFMFYSMLEMGFNQFSGSVRYGKKTNMKQPCGTFSVIENNGNVYSSTIKLHDSIELTSSRKNRKGEYNKKTIDITINLIDSYKIMKKELKEIATDVLDIDEMFNKLGDDYDYTTYREVGHELTLFEKCYLYNDVYILKEFEKQFYMKLDTDKITASAISFEKFLSIAFKKDTYNENYKEFEKVFPDLSSYVKISEIIKNSYRGGWTQGNLRYIGIKQLLRNAVSIDINSSYPAVIRYKMLPYGTPRLYKRHVNKDEMQKNGYDMRLLTIAFDGFKNNDEDNQIGEIQVGADNVEAFQMRGTQYAHTNIIGGTQKGDVITNYKLVGRKNASDKRRYTMTIWDFELESMLKNMSFYTEEKKYVKHLQLWVSNGKLKRGFEVLETLCFKGKVGVFGEAVDIYTEMKKQGKREGNACMTEQAKMMMNAFFGKMGASYDRKDREVIMDDEGLIKYGNVVHSYTASKKYYPAYASAVTAWGRCNLRDTLYKVGYNNVLYFDTDSLYTTLDEEELRFRVGDVLDDFELGKWKIEKYYDEFKCIGAKKYMLLDTDGKTMCKCAGLPKTVRENIRFDEFYLGNEFDGKNQKKAVKGGYILTTVRFRLSDNIYE